jgi:hypothetical protein
MSDTPTEWVHVEFDAKVPPGERVVDVDTKEVARMLRVTFGFRQVERVTVAVGQKRQSTASGLEEYLYAHKTHIHHLKTLVRHRGRDPKAVYVPSRYQTDGAVLFLDLEVKYADVDEPVVMSSTQHLSEVP